MKPEILYTNQDIYELLNNVAIAYEIQNKNFFQIRAYQNAAETIQKYPQSLYLLWKKDPKQVDLVPGVGDSILQKLGYLFEKQEYHPHLKEIFKNIHPAVFTFAKINGIGPKIAYKLTQELKFSKDPKIAIQELINYAKNDKISHIETFGEKSQSQILENAQNFLGNPQKIPLKQAQKVAKGILSYLQNQFPDTEFYTLGSLRRQEATVKDIDIAAKSSNSLPIINYFVDYPPSLQTIIKGDKKASIRLQDNLRIDLMVQPSQSFGSLLQHFTGSKQHNIKLREYALKLGYSLSEYGAKDLKTNKLYQFDTEKKFYHFLKLQLIPPPERQGKDELQKYHLP